MNTQQGMSEMTIGFGFNGSSRHAAIERRGSRRHGFEGQEIAVERFDGRRASLGLGSLVDLSSGGIRLRTRHEGVRPDQQIRIRVDLPRYAGICPFVETVEGKVTPKTHWTGWLAVTRVQPLGDGTSEVAGRLIDMDDLDRSMLGLYLSTQPLAA